MPAYPNHPTEADIRAALGDLPEGHYFSRDLLPVYLEWARANGKPVVTSKELGEAIRARVCLDSKTVKGATRWHLTKSALECRNWFEGPE